jgi:hypothetical protein
LVEGLQFDPIQISREAGARIGPVCKGDALLVGCVLPENNLAARGQVTIRKHHRNEIGAGRLNVMCKAQKCLFIVKYTRLIGLHHRNDCLRSAGQVVGSPRWGEFGGNLGTASTALKVDDARHDAWQFVER